MHNSEEEVIRKHAQYQLSITAEQANRDMEYIVNVFNKKGFLFYMQKVRNFGEKYGALGEGFIHIHHLCPLHTIKKDYVVDYKKDLIPVCPNCHAMIHRIPGGETMSAEELRAALKSTGSKMVAFTSVPPVRLQPQIDITPNTTPKTNVSEVSKKHFVGQRVFHTNAKFGPGIVKSETDTTVSITFDNGISTTFTKESFYKGLLLIQE